MLVPRIAAAQALRRDVREFDEPHAALDQSPREQTLVAIRGSRFRRRIVSVQLLRRFTLAALLPRFVLRGVPGFP